ncbi:hypothetical protein [Rhodococcus sp. Eu-32]|nr:hypothetical protein [Rhodococcus sp. Eu-32]
MWTEWTDPKTCQVLEVWACRPGPTQNQILDEKWEREIHAADPEGSEWGA